MAGADTSSFRKDLGPPPQQYRTPSPPHRFYEIISPRSTVWASRNASSYALDDYRTDPRSSRAYNPGYNGVAKQKKTRRGELDTFASIALATKDPSSTENSQDIRAWNPQFDAADTGERPAKRARSEKAASPEFQQPEPRPTTSYVQPADTRRLDAELLLNFSRAACVAASRANASTIDPKQSKSKRGVSNNRDELLNGDSIPGQQSAASQMEPFPPSPTFFRKQSQHQEASKTYSVGKSGYGKGRKLRGPDSEVLSNRRASASLGGERAVNGEGNDPQTQYFLEPEYQSFQHEGIAGFGEAPIARGDLAITFEDTWSAKAPDNDSKPFDYVPSAQNVSTSSREPLDGIEEPATAEETHQTETPNPTSTQSENPIISPSAKQKLKNAPSICASCNFSRDFLTLETGEGATKWINCNTCERWFHFACAGFRSEREVRGVDKYVCKSCETPGLKTTFVRKSNRAHNPIDYAGLNEGILKTSDEDPEHHYIKHFRSGTIKFFPESFARMRPELVTAEYFEKGDGMKEPVVIPAALNPRPSPIPDDPPKDDSREEQEPSEADNLQDNSVLETWLAQVFEYQPEQDVGQDALGMVIPHDLTVRKVSELYGPDEKIEVIDVKSQNGEDRRWNMRRWVDYYESKGKKVVRNVISLEFSQSKLGSLVRRPRIVRELDLQDSVWPAELYAKGEYPKVQFYCLMSVADCYTDFHIDFGGSSVFYHILKGRKTFFFIPPHEKHLKKYEEWCNSPAQNWTFLGEQTKECYRVDLTEGDTMLIPAGWIHAVWTPEDSLVIGGNFLTRLHYHLQIRVAQIEKSTHVARKFRYPHFQKVLWYAALRYLDEDPIPDSVANYLTSGQSFARAVPTDLEFDAWGGNSEPGAENYHARYYSKAELDGLPDLGRYLQRTALIAMGNITDGITVEIRNAVKRSIPKAHGHGEPLDVVKKFALWYTWKRGNEPIPHWAYPDYVPEGGAPELTEKKISVKAQKKLDREAAYQAFMVAPDRQSTRPRTQPQNLLAETVANSTNTGQPSKKASPAPLSETNGSGKKRVDGDPMEEPSQKTPTSAKKQKAVNGPKSSTPRRSACEACRKGRRACKHRDEPKTPLLIYGTASAADRPALASSTPTKDLTDAENPGSAKSRASGSSGPGDALKLSHVETVHADPSLPSAAGSVEGTNSSAIMDPSSAASSNAPLRTPGRTKACKDCRKSKVSARIIVLKSRLLTIPATMRTRRARQRRST